VEDWESNTISYIFQASTGLNVILTLLNAILLVTLVVLVFLGASDAGDAAVVL